MSSNDEKHEMCWLRSSEDSIKEYMRIHGFMSYRFLRKHGRYGAIVHGSVAKQRPAFALVATRQPCSSLSPIFRECVFSARFFVKIDLFLRFIFRKNVHADFYGFSDIDSVVTDFDPNMAERLWNDISRQEKSRKIQFARLSTQVLRSLKFYGSLKGIFFSQ